MLFARIAFLTLLTAALALAVPTPAAGELPSIPATQNQVQPRDDAADKGYEEAEDKRIKEPSNEWGSKEQVQRRSNDHANVNDSGEVLVPSPVREPDSEVVPVRRDDVRGDGNKSMGDTVQAIQHPSWQITRRQGGETDTMGWDNTDKVTSRPPRGRSV